MNPFLEEWRHEAKKTTLIVPRLDIVHTMKNALKEDIHAAGLKVTSELIKSGLPSDHLHE